MMKSNLKNQL